MPQRLSIGQRAAGAIGSILRKIGIGRSRPDPIPVDKQVREMALAKGSMEIEDLPRTLAEEFADDLKRLIEQQSFAWVPLSAGYARRKNMLGQDPRILIATGRYVNSIRPVQAADGSWVVGVPPEPLHGGSRYTLQDLARWLEFGTKRMPARPHWRPAMSLWKTKAFQAKVGLKHGVRTYLQRRGFR